MVKINKNKTVLSTIPESPLHADRFPAGAVENYLPEDAAAEQSFWMKSLRQWEKIQLHFVLNFWIVL